MSIDRITPVPEAAVASNQIHESAGIVASLNDIISPAAKEVVAVEVVTKVPALPLSVWCLNTNVVVGEPVPILVAITS